MIAQQKKDFTVALSLLEQALVLAPEKYRPAILDALGTNYYYLRGYAVAATYHERSLLLLNTLINDSVEKEHIVALSTLRLKVEFHCGNAYYELGMHKQARQHFEQARQDLRSGHDIKTAAQLYLKLGYSTYADVYTHIVLTYATNIAIQETEQEFQRAISYFLQSRMLYQVSSDRLGEAKARLSQAMVLLDLSSCRRQAARDKEKMTGRMPLINTTTLLDEAEEQCRQILLGWEPDTKEPTTEVEILLYSALAYLIRVSAQRAAVAQMNMYTDTAERERSIATYLCEQVVDTLAKPTFPWPLVYKIATFKEGTVASRNSAIPRITDAALYSDASSRHDITRSIVLFAIGEVAEVIGQATTQSDFAQACYTRANLCFRAALDAQATKAFVQDQDRSYLYRIYQRCIQMLQERKQFNLGVAESTYQTLIDLLWSALQTSYIAPL